MANDKSRNLQELFLNNVRKSHASVTVFLVNGVKLQGIITWFDSDSATGAERRGTGWVE